MRTRKEGGSRLSWYILASVMDGGWHPVREIIPFAFRYIDPVIAVRAYDRAGRSSRSRSKTGRHFELAEPPLKQKVELGKYRVFSATLGTMIHNGYVVASWPEDYVTPAAHRLYRDAKLQLTELGRNSLMVQKAGNATRGGVWRVLRRAYEKGEMTIRVQVNCAFDPAEQNNVPVRQ